MGSLFLRVFTVSAAVSVLLLPLLLCRRTIEKTYAPQTRWGLWLAVALVLLLAPWVPKPAAPVVVEAPDYALTLPAAPVRPQPAPAVPKVQPAAPAEPPAPVQPILPAGSQSQGAAPAKPESRPAVPFQPNVQPAVPADPEPAAPQRSSVPVTALLGAVWLAGLALVLLCQGLWYLLARRRLLRAARPLTGLEGYAAELDLEGKVRFYRCKTIPGPMTLGVLRPVILLPSGELAVAALRHELYHVKRRDVAYKLLLLCACSLHWFNPLVWLMYRMADRDVEACCDAAVVAGRDSGYKRSYGELLLSAAAEGRSVPFSTSFWGGEKEMKGRLTQLFRPGKQSRALVCLVLALAAALGTLVACRQAEKPKDGLYCSPYANVAYPVGEAEADGEDYSSLRLSLLQYSETEGPHGKPLGEYTLPLAAEVKLTFVWGMESRVEREDKNWEEQLRRFLHWPLYRDVVYPDYLTDYLVVTLEKGEVTELSWAQVSGNDAYYVSNAHRLVLSLPESWVGNYTVEEEGEELRFLYAENGQSLMTLHVVQGTRYKEGWESLAGPGNGSEYVYWEFPGQAEGPMEQLRKDIQEKQRRDTLLTWTDVISANQGGYVSKGYGFALRLPEDWEGKYFTREEDGMIWFYQKGGVAKPLFRIAVDPISILDPFRSDSDPSGYGGVVSDTASVLGEKDGLLFRLINEREEDWYDKEDHSIAAEEYRKMNRQAWQLGPGDFLPDFGTPELQPLTENTMPTLVYYDPDRDFLLYRTVDTAYFHYGDTRREYRPTQWTERRVLWRCDVSEDEKTVYLSDVLDDSADRDERFYEWDIGTRTLRQVDSIPAGVDHAAHVDGEELRTSGFLRAEDLRSNALQTADGTVVALTVDRTIGDGSFPYLCLTRMEPGKYPQSRFLTPERVPAPREYTDPGWGFTLTLPPSLEGQYYVQKGGNAWLFYDKEQFGSGSGFLLGLWAEDMDVFKASGSPNKVLGEKGNIVYTLSAWEDMEGVPAHRREAYQAMLEEVRTVAANDLDLSAVTRSSGYLWPLPYTQYGGDVILGREGDTLRILSPEDVTVQSVAGGKVVSVTTHPITKEQSVTVAHPDGRCSEYGHLEYIQLETGAEIERGGIIGFAKAEEGRRWLTFRLLEGGSSWDTARSVDPWSVEYRSYDFLPVAPGSVTLAGDPAVTQALWDVVYGSAPFYHVERKEYCCANALPDSDGQPVTVYRFAQVDLDNDTVPELVLWLRRGEDEYLLGSIVLHYQNGGVCGYPVGYRAMILETLKADGTIQWNNSAFEWGFARMDFRSGQVERTTWCENRGSQWEKYYVNGREIPVEDFEAEYQRQIAKEDAVWYSLSEVNPGGPIQTGPSPEEDIPPAEDVPLADKPQEPLDPTETVEVYARATSGPVEIDGKNVWRYMDEGHKERNLLVYGGRVYLPAAALSQWAGARVDWDRTAGRVDIVTGVSQGTVEVDPKWNWTTDYAQLGQEERDGVTALAWPNLQVTLDGGPRNLSGPPLEHRDCLYLPLDLAAELMWRKCLCQLRQPGDPRMGGREEEEFFIFLYIQPTPEQFREAEEYYAGVRDLIARYVQAMEDLAAQKPETLEEFLEKADNICALVKSFGGLKMPSSPVLLQDARTIFAYTQGLSISPVLIPVKEIGGEWAQMAWGQLYDALAAPWRPDGESRNVPANTYDDYQKLTVMLDAAESTLADVKAN